MRQEPDLIKSSVRATNKFELHQLRPVPNFSRIVNLARLLVPMMQVPFNNFINSVCDILL